MMAKERACGCAAACWCWQLLAMTYGSSAQAPARKKLLFNDAPCALTSTRVSSQPRRP